MTTPDGRYTIVFNGEIYNFQELRAELAAAATLSSAARTARCLLHAFSEWGLGCLRRLNGMFAFAIWDRDKKMLTLARDRFGVKPLYYAEAGDCFLFASEIKGILAYGKLQAKLDREGLAEYLSFQNFFTDRTLSTASSCCRRHLHAGEARQRTVRRCNEYWDFAFQEPDKVASDEDYLEELDRLFQQAVSRQLISDVDIGSYLSGGMDSGSITALAGRQLPWIRTFTVGFDLHSASGVELGFDERKRRRVHVLSLQDRALRDGA